MRDLSPLLPSVAEIQAKLGYTFRDQNLLIIAFVHRSFVNENRELIDAHNERLEFLGDAVLELIASDFLYRELPSYSEGELSPLKAQIVEASRCISYVEKLQVGDDILLGKGEQMNEGKGRGKILADLFEAIVGAIYLDGGLAEAQLFFDKHFISDIRELIEKPLQNYKALLQDYSQKKYQKPPVYQTLQEIGPDHSKLFHMVVEIDGKEVGQGRGSSKKLAEQDSARAALLQLKLIEEGE